jgi:hypothetical protein
MDLQLAKPFFASCRIFINECKLDSLPKLVVESSLYFAKITGFYNSFCGSTESKADKGSAIITEAKTLLEQARDLCVQPSSHF